MGCIVSVPQDRVAAVEKFGRFEKIANPGCVCLPIPCICSVAGMQSTRIQQIYVEVQTKTQDNVFVSVTVAIQFKMLENAACRYNAFYKLHNPGHQITSMVEDVVRGALPKLELDNAYLEKRHIAVSLQETLSQDMGTYGYEIIAALVTDIKPDVAVRRSMNDINANRRNRLAQAEYAEAAKFTQIKQAEASAEATYLEGEGVARQRRAIAEGITSSVQEFSSDVEGLAHSDVLGLMLMNQYLDTLKDVAKGSDCTTVLAPRRKKIPRGPASIGVVPCPPIAA